MQESGCASASCISKFLMIDLDIKVDLVLLTSPAILSHYQANFHFCLRLLLVLLFFFFFLLLLLLFSFFLLTYASHFRSDSVVYCFCSSFVDFYVPLTPPSPPPPHAFSLPVSTIISCSSQLSQHDPLSSLCLRQRVTSFSSNLYI